MNIGGISGGTAEADNVTKLVALLSDADAVKARLKEIQDASEEAHARFLAAEQKEAKAQAAVDGASAEAEAILANAAALLESATKMEALAKKMLERAEIADASMNARENALVDRERAIAKAESDFDAESRARAQTLEDAARAARASASERDAALAQRERAVADREERASRTLTEAEQLKMTYQSKLDALKELAAGA